MNCWKFINFMRPYDNFHPYQLSQPLSFRPSKPHNCPHCNCGSNTNICSQIVARPMSPNFNKVSRFQNVGYQPQQHAKMPSVGKILPRVVSNKPGNIYYRRTDNQNSNRSIDSSRSISREGRIGEAVASPNKSVTRINIRYLSPQFNNIEAVPRCQSPVKNQYGIPFSQPKIKQRNEPIKEPTVTIEQEPKVPSILKRKSSTSKRKSNDLGSVCSSPKDEIREQEKDLGTMSAIMSRKAIKSSNFPASNQYISKGQWQRSACDMLLEQEQQKAIANQITKDLKLNYDYFSTQDISKLSENNTK